MFGGNYICTYGLTSFLWNFSRICRGWRLSSMTLYLLMAILSRQEEKFRQFRPAMFFTGKMSTAPVMDGESSHATKALKIQEDIIGYPLLL